MLFRSKADILGSVFETAEKHADNEQCPRNPADRSYSPTAVENTGSRSALGNDPNKPSVEMGLCLSTEDISKIWDIPDHRYRCRDEAQK